MTSSLEFDKRIVEKYGNDPNLGPGGKIMLAAAKKALWEAENFIGKDERKTDIFDEIPVEVPIKQDSQGEIKPRVV